MNPFFIERNLILPFASFYIIYLFNKLSLSYNVKLNTIFPSTGCGGLRLSFYIKLVSIHRIFIFLWLISRVRSCKIVYVFLNNSLAPWFGVNLLKTATRSKIMWSLVTTLTALFVVNWLMAERCCRLCAYRLQHASAPLNKRQFIP